MKLFITEKDDGPIPSKSVRRRPPDPLDKLEDWLKIKSFILSGKARPMEVFGFQMTPALDKITGVDTVRTARDHMRAFLKAAHLDSDYHIRMVHPDENDPDKVIMRMWYEPPAMAAARRKKA